MKLEILPRTDLAIRAIKYIGRNQGSNSSEIASALDTTSGYLTQILRPAVEAGYLETTRGPQGGYRLAAMDLSLLDIVEALEGPTDNGVCVLRGSTCHAAQPCGMHDAWAEARTALMAHLDSVPVTEPHKEGVITC